MYTAESCTFQSAIALAHQGELQDPAGGFYTVSEATHGLLLCHLKKQVLINSSSDIPSSSASVRCVRQSASETASERLYCTKGVEEKL